MTEPSPPRLAKRFHLELLKLMLHVAWSDDEVHPHEARLILGTARRWHIPQAELALLERCLEQRQALPAPDLGLLRRHTDEVLAAVRAVIASDLHVSGAEREMLAQIQELLGAPRR
jgi:hypothetical protein